MEASEVTAPELTVTQIVDALEQDIHDEAAFEKAFKYKLTAPVKLGARLWSWHEDTNSFRIVTPNGSILQLRFYDTVKPIYDYMNVEVPGKESFLSYIEVVIRPAGIKGYRFKSDLTQAVWGDSKSKATIKHEAALAKLAIKAKALGFDLGHDHWITKYDRTAY